MLDPYRKICPKCGVESIGNEARCRNCRYNLKYVPIDNSQYHRDLEELEQYKIKMAKIHEMHKTIIPIAITVYICLFFAFFIFGTLSRSIVTTIYILLPLIGYGYVTESENPIFLILKCLRWCRNHLFSVVRINWDRRPDVLIGHLLFLLTFIVMLALSFI